MRSSYALFSQNYHRNILQKNSTPPHGKSHNSILSVHAVLSLIIYYRLRAIDNRISHLDATVGWKTMHVDSIFFRQGHASLVTNPMLVLTDCINQFRRVFDRNQGTPTLGVDHVSVNKSLIHIINNLKTATGFTRVFGSIAQNLRHQLKLRRMSQNDICAELREQLN